MSIITLFVGLILFFTTALTLIVLVYMISRAMRARGDGRLSDEESQIMQELFRGMKKMEERVESLETLLFEQVPRE